MGRMVDVDDLVSTEGIAEHYEITRQAVDLWTKKPDFPEPVRVVVGRFRFWLLPEVAAWRAAQPPPRGPVQHGSARKYAIGCRCDICRAAATAKHRQWAAKARLAANDPRHGTASAYMNYGCRCEPCRAAGSAKNRRSRERRLAREVAS